MSIYNFTIEGGIAKMEFTPTDRYPADLVESSFNREKEYLLRVQKFSWAPELVEINPATKTISFKWYDNPLPRNWKEQLEQIVRDLHAEKIFKPSFYQKYFYIPQIIFYQILLLNICFPIQTYHLKYFQELRPLNIIQP